MEESVEGYGGELGAYRHRLETHAKVMVMVGGSKTQGSASDALIAL